MVGHLPSKCKALGSIPEKKRKRKKRKKRGNAYDKLET
jgi:hypothetical protein